MNRYGDWMQLASGGQFWPLDPRPEEIHVSDIAHALALTNRYGGHTRVPYSVAEHCYHMSQWVEAAEGDPEPAFQALMHDSTEAYLGDIIRPLKKGLTQYVLAEKRLWRVICQRFGMREQLYPSVKEADNRICLNERDALMEAPPADWNLRGGPLEGVTIHAWDWQTAEQVWLLRFHELTRHTGLGVPA